MNLSQSQPSVAMYGGFFEDNYVQYHAYVRKPRCFCWLYSFQCCIL